MEVKFTCYYRNRFGETVLQTFHIGQERGDLTQADPDDYEDSDGHSAGPPCPPWAGNSNKLGLTDARAQVCLADLVVIITRPSFERNPIW